MITDPQAGPAAPGGEEAARYKALFDNSLDALYVSREDGGVIDVNPAFVRLFGYSRAELIGMSAADLYADPADRQRFQARITEDGAVQEFEAGLRRRDGAVRTCLITASTRRSGSGALEYEGIVRDVTERRREQAELLRTTAALRRSNAELEQFAYVASHDLQEPLRKIRAFGDRLASVAADRLDERGADYLRRMIAASERMQTLIERLLLYSRVSSRPMEVERVELDAVLEEVLGDLEPQIAEADATLVMDPLPALDADPLQMRQLFQNLVSNALKYRAPDRPLRIGITAGYLDVRGRAVSPPPDGAAATVRIQVRDNGIGFEPEFADRIFELFQRLHSRDEFDGTGIGLGVCRRIAERHRGSITADARPGEGATFTVLLPLTQPDP